MKSFGRDASLQEAKKAEVAARSPRLGGLVRRMLVPESNRRLSASEVAAEAART
jgi:hypothetical protein